MSIRSIPLNVWRSTEFDCEQIYKEIFNSTEESVGAMEKVQEEIKFRLSENTTYFTTHCTALTSNSAPITSSLGDLATVLELENERMDKTLDRAHGFAGELQRVAGDIIKLSNERRDLTQSITKKRQFQMITSGLDRIDSISNNSKLDFKEISNLILATEQLLQQHCDNNINYDLIGPLTQRLQNCRARIGQKILLTFDSCIDKGSGKLTIEDPTDLFACCLAADVLENNLRAEIIKIYLDKQFNAYRSLHPSTHSVLDLKTIEKRFKWAQRMLNFYEKTFKLTFPSEWQVEILLAQAMSNWIKEDIVSIFAAVPSDRRVSEDIFTQALSEANSFDRYISLRFENALNSSLTQAFQDFHYFLFEAKEEEFGELVKKLLPKDSVRSVSKLLKKDQLVIFNFDQFFLFFSGVLDTFIHLSSMSSGVLLVQFSFFLSDCLESLNQYIESQFDLISSLSARKWTFEVGRLLCCLLNTLDYCLTNSQDQADRILQQIRSPDLQSQVNLESIQQKLLVTRTIGMSVLLTRFENDLQPHLQQYVKIDWEQIQTPTDPSNFQLKIIEMFEETSKFPLNQVVKTLQTQTCRLFLEKLIRSFMIKLQNSLFKFKFINEIGAEQLMIDLFGFRSFFAQRLPSSNWNAKELAMWSQNVSKATDRYELYLKVLLTPIDQYSPAPFVQSYLLLLADFNLESFVRLLEIKGLVRRSDQGIFIEEFNKHIPPTPSDLNLSEPKKTNGFDFGFTFRTTGQVKTGIETFNTDKNYVDSGASTFLSRIKSSLNVVSAIKKSYTRKPTTEKS